MTFIVTLLALIIERFFDWSHLREWSWFMKYEARLTSSLAKHSPYFILAIIILPLLLAVLMLQWLTKEWLFGFPNLVMQLILLLYCLGPKNLWANGFACINSLADEDKPAAAEKIKATFSINDESYTHSIHRHLIDNIFIEANRRVFAVVFWYLLLGPVGALLYRTVILSTNEVALARAANTVQDVLNWIPSRLLTILFALGGHFVSVITCWRKKVLLGLDGNELLLTECGIAALGTNDPGNLPEDGTVERHAISLIDRVFVILLVVLAVSVLLA